MFLFLQSFFKGFDFLPDQLLYLGDVCLPAVDHHEGSSVAVQPRLDTINIHSVQQNFRECFIALSVSILVFDDDLLEEHVAGSVLDDVGLVVSREEGLGSLLRQRGPDLAELCRGREIVDYAGESDRGGRVEQVANQSFLKPLDQLTCSSFPLLLLLWPVVGAG